MCTILSYLIIFSTRTSHGIQLNIYVDPIGMHTYDVSFGRETTTLVCSHQNICAKDLCRIYDLEHDKTPNNIGTSMIYFFVYRKLHIRQIPSSVAICIFEENCLK